MAFLMLYYIIPANSPEAERLFNRVVDQYIEPRHNKVPQIYVTRKIGNTASTQIETIDVDEKNNADVEKTIEKMEDNNEFTITNFDDECSSSDEDLNGDI